MLAFLPGLFIMAHIDLHKRFLNSLGKNNIPMICLTIGVISHFFLSLYFVIYQQKGIVGTGIAGVISNFITFVL
jgi:Na+-driven multidrug efflux pump